MPTITACLIVKNGGSTLDNCLRGLKSNVDEIIVTDTGSKDNTLKIAGRYVDKIYHFKWNKNFSDARNFCQSKASSDYVLWIDADETIDGAEIDKIKQSISEFPETDVFSLIRINLSKKYRPYYEKTERVIRTLKPIRWIWSVHEILDYPKDSTNVGEINSIIIHKTSSGRKFWRSRSEVPRLIQEEPDNSSLQYKYLKILLKEGDTVSFRMAAEKIDNIHWKFNYYFNELVAELRKDNMNNLAELLSDKLKD